MPTFPIPHRGRQDQPPDPARGRAPSSAPPPPPRPRQRSPLVTAALITSTVAYCLLLPAVAAVGLLFLIAMRGASNAIQEAAAGAACSTVLIGLYVGARCVEKAAAGLDRYFAPPMK